MEILKGLLKIGGKDGTDVYEKYGAFLVEDTPGDFSNYNELLKPPAMKPYTAVSFREEDGEKLPDTLPSPRYEARDLTLYFALVADNKAGWFKRYRDFLSLLKTGWLTLWVRELDKTYRVYYKQCTQYTQLTPLDNGQVGAKLKVTFREPNPAV